MSEPGVLLLCFPNGFSPKGLDACNISFYIKHVEVTEDTITAYLIDGRVISVPLAWSWRLSDATAEQRNKWELIGDGQGVHWPDIDEDISANGMLTGIPARRPQHVTA